MLKQDFLNTISSEEWRLNGHRKKDGIHILNAFDDLIAYLSPGSLIDLGCGTAFLYRYIKECKDLEIAYLGIDANPDSIEFVQKQYPHISMHVETGDLFGINPKRLLEFDNILYSVGDTNIEYIRSLVSAISDSLHKQSQNSPIFIFCHDRIQPETRRQIAKLSLKYQIQVINSKFFVLREKPISDLPS